ncbi:MAG: hypothetical protein NTV72_02580, partial [Candidatus Taylorbacteria bacterium]|nr:hypothetical protein [Candidatus Taylorbacteria bacterium]
MKNILKIISVLFFLVLVFPVKAENYEFFGDDFELEDTVNWARGVSQASGTVSITKDLPHSGLFSAKHVLNGEGVNTLMGSDFTSTSTAYASAYFYLDPALSITGDLIIFQLTNGVGSTGQRVYLRNTGGNLYIKLTGQATPGTTAVTKGSWHNIELKYSDVDGTAAVYLDGSETAEVSASGLTLSDVDVIKVGTAGVATGIIYFDDILVNNSRVGAPSVNIKVRHANTFGRSTMKLRNTLFGQVSSDKLVVDIDGSEVYRKTGSITGEEYVTLALSTLTAGNHTLDVKLLNSSDVQKVIYTETIRKYINGTPTVSIDENNSISRNGTLVFPVTPYMQNPSGWISYWNNGWANMYGWASGYANSYSKEQYQSFIETVGQPSIGPDERFCNDVFEVRFCINTPDAVSLASGYADALKDHPNVFMWTWVDEPDLGGSTPRVLPSTIQAVTDAVHDIDFNHPQALNLYGWGPGGTKIKGFLYPNLVSDLYSFDMYPSIYQTTFSYWVTNMDLWQKYNYGLTPWTTFIEAGIQPCPDAPICTGGHGPNSDQLRMEAWLAVVHGMKGIQWWGPEVPDYTYIDDAHHAQMAKFVDQIGRLKNVVLSAAPPRTVSDNSDTAGNRVDTLVREDADNIYVFAVRLTENSEADTLSTEFNVSGLSGVKNATVFDESRTVSTNDGVFTDSFAPNDVHIYQIPKADSTDTSITSFNFLSPSVTGIVDNTAHTVSLTVPYGTNVTALVPTISITGSSTSPLSGVAQNFTSPVIYTVTAQDTSTTT